MRRIEPVTIAAVVLAGAVLGAATLLTVGGLSSKPPLNAGDLLGTAQSAEQVQLYPPGQQVVTAYAYLSQLNPHAQPFKSKLLSNGDQLDSYLRADLTKEFSLEWYPGVSTQPRRLKEALIYAADGKTVVGQADFRLSGTRKLRGIRLDNGNYQTTSYYQNGVSPAELTVVGRGPQKWDTAYSYMLVYFPGTTTPRLKATSTYSQLMVDYFRPDGTHQMSGQLWSNSGMLTVFDASGKQATRQISLMYDRQEVDGLGHMQHVQMTDLTVMNAAGVPVAEWNWDAMKHSIDSYEQFNVKVPNPTAGGAPILCSHVMGWYTADDGTLSSVRYQPADDSIKPWEVTHTPKENIRPPAPPAADMVIPALDPDLPIPLPSEGDE